MISAAKILRGFSRIRTSYRVIGARSTATWLFLRLNKKARYHGRATWRVRPRVLPAAIEVQLRGASDFDVFSQIFIQEEYAPLRGLESISFILDLGANVGYSSAYFLDCFPDSTVLAVEPDDRNVAICRETLSPFGERARVIHGAAWSTPGTLQLSRGSYGDGREWATQVKTPASGEAGGIQAWDIPGLLSVANRDQIDLLKIDIERAELEVFGATSAAWLHKVRNLCIELHGPDCDETFFQALRAFRFDVERSGELTICTNLQPRAVASMAVV